MPNINQPSETMPAEITMPQLSDTMTEGTLVKWLKKEGDPVKSGEIIAEVETDKATMEMESFESGTLAAILVKEGEKAPVGAAIAVVAKSGEKPEDIRQKSGKTTASREASSVSTKTVSVESVGNKIIERAEGGEAEGPSQDAHKASAHASAEVADSIQPPAPNGQGNRVKASPLARRIARDLGIDLTSVRGSGPGGRIIQADVLAAKERSPVSGKSAASPLPARVPSGQTEKIVLTKMRQTIATRLQQSKQNIPHFYETIDIDMTAAVELRKKLLEMYEKKEGIRISIGDIIAKAVACALKAVPQLNATFDEKTNTVTRYGDVNLGMAVALPDGLIVPVLRNIDQMGFKEIRVRSADLVDRARAQKLKREEMSGATFTVSNLGLMGIREFSAIVNPPEVGILAIGASEDKAVVRDGQVTVRNMMTVTLSCDHRVIDGAVAAQFLVSLKNFLEVPALMLM
jgi:pyruvate dehydrogenase E2 component (dihydrolipoamide acetyltransferase)